MEVIIACLVPVVIVGIVVISYFTYKEDKI